MLDDLHLPTEPLLHPSYEIALLVGAIHPDQLEARKAVFERGKQVFATVVVLNTGLVHQEVHDQAVGIDEQMALAAFDLFAPVVTARPPFWLVLTD